MVRRSALDEILNEIRQLRYRLDDIEAVLSKWNPRPLKITELESDRLFSLSDHLRKTYLTVMSRGECSATEVSNLSGRSRAMESNYLNQLVRMGWLTKRRDSKTARFCLISKNMLKEHPQQS